MSLVLAALCAIAAFALASIIALLLLLGWLYDPAAAKALKQ